MIWPLCNHCFLMIMDCSRLLGQEAITKCTNHNGDHATMQTKIGPLPLLETRNSNDSDKLEINKFKPKSIISDMK